MVTTLLPLFGNVNSVPTHQHSWQYNNHSQKHLLDPYSNPGRSHYWASKSNQLKGSKVIDNKNILRFNIKLRSWVKGVCHTKDNYNLGKHVLENKGHFSLQPTSPCKKPWFTAHASQVFFGLSNLTANSYVLSTVLHVDIKLRIFSETSAAEGREKLPINVY